MYIVEYLHAFRQYNLECNNGKLIWILISFPRFNILVCVAYRSPSVIHLFRENFHYSIEKAIKSSRVNFFLSLRHISVQDDVSMKYIHTTDGRQVN